MEIKEYQAQFLDAIAKHPNHPAFTHALKEIQIMDFTNAIAGEAGELANIGKKVFRKSMGYRVEKYVHCGEYQLKEELTDVLSNCLEFIIAMGWDLEELLLNKLKEKNQ